MPAKKPDAARLELQAEAVAMRRAGHSYAAIAAKLKAPKTTIHTLIREVLNEYRARTQDDIAEHVATQLLRLDHALSVIEKRINSGSLEAIDRLVKIEDRRSRLLGLDMPARIAPTDPTGQREYGGEGCGLAVMLAEARRLKEMKG